MCSWFSKDYKGLNIVIFSFIVNFHTYWETSTCGCCEAVNGKTYRPHTGPNDIIQISHINWASLQHNYNILLDFIPTGYSDWWTRHHQFYNGISTVAFSQAA